MVYPFLGGKTHLRPFWIAFMDLPGAAPSLPQVMVNMQMFVSSPDLTTPHGGAPFQGWRKGRGPETPGPPWGLGASHVVFPGAPAARHRLWLWP